MRRQWQLWLLALGYFTRIPVPAQRDFDAGQLSDAAKFLPMVGWLVGLVAALTYLLTAQVLPRELAILLSMLASIYITGALHEDGLADASDGLGGGWDKAQVLAIMADSRLGSYGAIALVLALLTKYQALVQMPVWLLPVILVTAHTLSRLAAVLLMASLDYVKAEGKARPLGHRPGAASLLLALLTGLWPLAIFCWYSKDAAMMLAFTLLPVVLLWLYLRARFKRCLGGYTGDCLGAVQQLTEITLYLGVLAWALY